MKPFQTFKIVTKKFSFTSLDRSRGIENWSMTLFNRSNRNQTAIESGKSFRIIFLITSINRAKGSTGWTYWISNFHLKISKTWILLYQLCKTIFSKIKHHYYNLSIYIPIYIIEANPDKDVIVDTTIGQWRWMGTTWIGESVCSSSWLPLDDEGEWSLFVLNFSCSKIYGSVF